MADLVNNESLVDQTQISTSDMTKAVDGDMPDGLFSVLMEYTGYLMLFISAFGFTGNILIIVAYAKIGFSESINISYFALGVSDFICVSFLTWHAICFIPVFADSDLNFDSWTVEVPTGGHTSVTFLKTTAWITAFISLERCLCVVFPLKVKTIVKRKRTIVVIILIFVMTVIPLMSIVFYTYQFVVGFDEGKNKTLVMVKYRKSDLSDALTNVSYFYKLVWLNTTPFAIVLVCTIVLAVHLNRSAAWRLGNSGRSTKQAENSDDKAQRKYAKDMRVAKSVMTIAVTFIVVGTISTVRYLVAVNWPGFHPAGTFAKLFEFASRVDFALSLVNSSLNFIIYYKMGRRFRATINQMFCRKGGDKLQSSTSVTESTQERY